MALTGTNFVRFTRHGLHAIRGSWAKVGDRFEVRRQALKLRFWDERHLHPPGMLFDHSYESIKSLPGLGVYELRLDEAIGGQSNIRVVFFDPPSQWQSVPAEARPLRVVWVLEAMPKRRNDWTANEITRFCNSRPSSSASDFTASDDFTLFLRRERRPTMIQTGPEQTMTLTSKAGAETLSDVGRRPNAEKAKAPAPSLDILLTAALQSAAPIVLALMGCDDELRAGAIELFKQLNSGELDAEACHATTALLAEMLFPDPGATGTCGLDIQEAEEVARSTDSESRDILARMDEEEAVFARQVQQLMEAKGLTQAELAAKVGLGQPAISMMLNRTCRPQRKTVLRFAQALEVAPEELWPRFQP